MIVANLGQHRQYHVIVVFLDRSETLFFRHHYLVDLFARPDARVLDRDILVAHQCFRNVRDQSRRDLWDECGTTPRAADRFENGINRTVETQ